MPLFPALTDPNSIPTGDMPGDKVHITDWHLAAAATLYPALREQLDPVLAAGRAVVAVYGGSGVGNPARASDPLPWQGQAQSLVLTLPPLAVLVLVCRG